VKNRVQSDFASLNCLLHSAELDGIAVGKLGVTVSAFVTKVCKVVKVHSVHSTDAFGRWKRNPVQFYTGLLPYNKETLNSFVAIHCQVAIIKSTRH
jgi:hypothetical protein